MPHWGKGKEFEGTSTRIRSMRGEHSKDRERRGSLLLASFVERGRAYDDWGAVAMEGKVFTHRRAAGGNKQKKRGEKQPTHFSGVPENFQRRVLPPARKRHQGGELFKKHSIREDKEERTSISVKLTRGSADDVDI